MLVAFQGFSAPPGGKKTCLVENKRLGGKVVQTVKANLGAVTSDQIPYLFTIITAENLRLQ
jgi:hypothetical protein